MLVSTGVDARAGLAGVAAPELDAPFFCLLGCLALMSDMIKGMKIRSASFELHWTKSYSMYSLITLRTFARKKQRKLNKIL